VEQYLLFIQRVQLLPQVLQGKMAQLVALVEVPHLLLQAQEVLVVRLETAVQVVRHMREGLLE
jgi:hypothetical protein